MAKWRNVKISPTGELYTSESQLQIYCVKWFRTVHRQFEKLLFAIPNGALIGGAKNQKTGHPIGASILKSEGMTEGVPDLLLALPRGGFSGLFIEMKTIVGSLSPEQREYLELLASVGYAVCSPKTADQFDQYVTAYMNQQFTQLPIWTRKREIAKKLKINLAG